MDYEKKYKEALEKARQLCAYPTTKPFISDLQDLFPELYESKDENIRKELIEFTKTRGGFKQEWITWLEKKGKKPTWGKDDEYRVEILYALCEEEMNKSLVNSTAFRELQETRNWLNSLKERMGE